MKKFLVMIAVMLGLVINGRFVMAEEYKTAIFAGGCFWCMEKPFEEMEGVIAAVSGYTGGEEENPSYQEVSSGRTGHTEAVEITYDPTKISYEELLDRFWMTFDPTDKEGQFADRGAHYRPGIFYQTEEEKKLAEASKKALQESGRFDEKIVTPIEQAGAFYPAEEYHQDYYKKNSFHYQAYSIGSGRKGFIEKHWDKK